MSESEAKPATEAKPAPRYRLVNFEHESADRRALYGVTRTGPCWLLVDLLPATPRATFLGARAGAAVATLVDLLNKVNGEWHAWHAAGERRAAEQAAVIRQLGADLSEEQSKRARAEYNLAEVLKNNEGIGELRRMMCQFSTRVFHGEELSMRQKADRYDNMVKQVEQMTMERDTAGRMRNEAMNLLSAEQARCAALMRDLDYAEAQARRQGEEGSREMARLQGELEKLRAEFERRESARAADREEVDKLREELAEARERLSELLKADSDELGQHRHAARVEKIRSATLRECIALVVREAAGAVRS